MKKYTYEEFVKYRQDCVDYLSDHHLLISNEVLPIFVDNGQLIYHCFSPDKVELSYKGCIECDKVDILHEMFAKEITLDDAIKLGDSRLVYDAIDFHNYLGKNLNNNLKEWMLNGNKDYYDIIAKLIELGAVYIFSETKEYAFNNFIKKLALDIAKIRLSINPLYKNLD